MESKDPQALEPSVPVGQVEVPYHPPRSGDLCPHCDEGRLDYDGLLNLACPNCGYSLGGCFT